MVIIMISTLIAFAANRHTINHPGVIGVFFVAMVSLFTITYFISLYGDLAEGILISVFVEERLSQFGKQVNIHNQFEERGTITRPPQIVKDTYMDDINHVYDNATFVEYLKGHRAQSNLEHAPVDFF